MRQVKDPGERRKISGWACLAVFTALTVATCARAPDIVTDPAAEPVPPPAPPKFAMEPYHRSMSEEMKASYFRADEILVGVVEGVTGDKASGTASYVSDFRRFDKDTLSWTAREKLVMQVDLDRLRPKFIRSDRFERLIDLDKTGICWDFDEGTRNIYLVEGRENLMFIEYVFDDAGQEFSRNLIDVYPETRECRATDVFVLMVRDLYLSRESSTS